MKKLLNVLQKAENLILVVTFIVMVATMFVQVANRNTLKIPVSGLEELAKYCMVYMVMLGTELGLRDGTQIAVTGVVDKFKGKTKKIIQIISKLIVVIYSGFMTRIGFNMVMKQAKIGQKSPGLQIPMTIPYFALLLSFAIITVIQLFILINMIKNLNKEEEGETS